MDTNVATADGIVGVRKVDTARGSLDGSVSSQWYARPDDQRFLSLTDLQAFLQARREASFVSAVETKEIRIKAYQDDPRRLEFVLPDNRSATPNHFAFGQMCSRIGAPAGFIRDKLHYTAGPVIHECLQRSNAEVVKVLGMEREDAGVEFRAVTGVDYGRVWDAEVVEAILQVMDDGTWKVPGVMNWNNGTYDPTAPVTKQSTTLYASDRDVFVFLCRDQYPIEIGKLADGSPDWIFPGAIIWNSEVGSKSLGLTTMYLRGICMNRNLWGVEGKKELTLRHSKGLPARFLGEALPTLKDFSNTSASTVARKVAAAKAKIVGNDDDEVKEFLSKRLDLSKKASNDVFESVYGLEGHKARSLWDVVQGATAVARDTNYQEDRVAKERAAGKLMALVD